MPHDGQKSRDALNTEAARWVIALASDRCDDVTRQQFKAWRASSPVHEVAFEREQLTWERTERLRTLRPAGHPESHVESSHRGQRWQSWLGGSSLASRYGRMGSVAAGLLLAAVMAVFLWINATTDVYVTAVGERRSVQLEDGSNLELNTDTKVAVRMTASERHLELIRGESMFDVSHDAARPFTVAMGDNSVRAVGTAFNIRRDPDTYRVLVTEGMVEVTGKATASSPAYHLRLPAGSTAIYDQHGMASRVVTEAEKERALSWRSGTISLSGESLAAAAAEFNRYNSKQIVIADPAIAGLQLGGYFDAHDLEGFVKVLTAAFALEVSTSGDDIFLKGTGQTAPRPDEAP